MKILATADTHFGFKTGRTVEVRKIMYQRMFEVFDDLIDYAKQNHIEAILHGGDMFNRSKPQDYCISDAYKLLEHLVENDIALIGIPGNHDKSNLPETLLSHHYPNLYLENRISLIDLEEFFVLTFPYTYQPQKQFQYITQKIKKVKTKPIIILCHQLFNEASFGPHNYIFRNRVDVLKSSILPKHVPLIITGHIHQAQNIQNNRVIYPGSLERTSFAEIIEYKGFLEIEIEDDFMDINFIKLSSLEMEVQEIDLSYSNSLLSSIDEIEPNPMIRTLIRLLNRSLTPEEISKLYDYLGADEYPFLRISPNKPNITLKKLYGSYETDFTIKKTIRSSF